MTISALCPICGQTVQLPDDVPGRVVACARCRATLVTAGSGKLFPQASAVQFPMQPPANPFADAPGGYPYPPGYGQAPFTPGYLPLAMTREAALARVQGPGVVLQIFGGLLVLSSLGSLLVLLIPEAREDEATPLILAATVPLGLAAGAFMVFCGGRLKSLRSYVLVMTSVVLLMLVGLLVCPVLALPGIWPLIVLLDQQVKAHFGTRPHA